MTNENKIFYVYEWYNTETNEVFYVGKGCHKRYLETKKGINFFKNTFKTMKLMLEKLKKI